MAATLTNLARRYDVSGQSFNPTTVALLVVLLVLSIIASLLVAILFLMRRRRRARENAPDTLPMYTDKRASTASHHRRTVARPSQSIHITNEKPALTDESHADVHPESSRALPEIRVTFPEEFDASGKRQSGKVVVVRVNDSGVGLEPVDESLPTYQQSQGDRFQSVDLESVGGLVEKPRNAPPAHGWD